MKPAQSLGFAALIVLGLGCGTDAFYAETQPLDPDLGWEADEEATFEWQVTDTLVRYDFSLTSGTINVTPSATSTCLWTSPFRMAGPCGIPWRATWPMNAAGGWEPGLAT